MPFKLNLMIAKLGERRTPLSPDLCRMEVLSMITNSMHLLRMSRHLAARQIYCLHVWHSFTGIARKQCGQFPSVTAFPPCLLLFFAWRHLILTTLPAGNVPRLISRLKKGNHSVSYAASCFSLVVLASFIHCVRIINLSCRLAIHLRTEPKALNGGLILSLRP
jgi:hypothetical protein